MSILNPTPPDRLTDRQGRPYFLWDMDMSLDQFRESLRHGDPRVRAYFLGKLMRQAKPDDVFSFASVTEIRELWPERALPRAERSVLVLALTDLEDSGPCPRVG